MNQTTVLVSLKILQQTKINGPNSGKNLEGDREPKKKEKEHIFHTIKKYTTYHGDIAQWWPMYK